jgi:hypothetical protein
MPAPTTATASNGGAPDVRAQAAARLDALRADHRRARDHLERLDAWRADLADLLLRQSGAIQVLTELLGEAGPEPEAHDADPDARADPAGSSFITGPDRV